MIIGRVGAKPKTCPECGIDQDAIGALMADLTWLQTIRVEYDQEHIPLAIEHWAGATRERLKKDWE